MRVEGDDQGTFRPGRVQHKRRAPKEMIRVANDFHFQVYYLQVKVYVSVFHIIVLHAMLAIPHVVVCTYTDNHENRHDMRD